MESVRLPLDTIVDDGCGASTAQDVVCGGAALQQVSVRVLVFICAGSEFTFMRLLLLSHLAQWIDSCVMSSRGLLPVPMSAMSLFGEEGGGALPANFYGLCCALKVGQGFRAASITRPGYILWEGLCVLLFRVGACIGCADVPHIFGSACKFPSTKAKGMVQVRAAAAAAVICINLAKSSTWRVALEILPWKTFGCYR
jgi:hypothetical protein